MVVKPFLWLLNLLDQICIELLFMDMAISMHLFFGINSNIDVYVLNDNVINRNQFTIWYKMHGCCSYIQNFY